MSTTARPRAGASVDLRELWRYKDLIWLFVKRDFTVMYKQTVLGPAWILINPLHVHGHVLRHVRHHRPPVHRRCTADFVLPGRYGAVGLLLRPASIRCRARLPPTPTIFSKVYFPRLAMPISTMLSGLINFLVQFALFFVLLLVYLAKGEVSPHWGMLLLTRAAGAAGGSAGPGLRHHRVQPDYPLPRFDGRGDLWRAAMDVWLARWSIRCR